MASVGDVIRSEIVRLAKKVARQHIGPVQTSVTAQRKQLIDLKKQIAQLEREVSALRRATAKNQPASDAAHSGSSKQRVTSKGIHSLRKRLGLSAEDFGRLVKVSAQTIYNWETKKTSPSLEQVPALIRLRSLGKRDVQTLLSAIKAK